MNIYDFDETIYDSDSTKDFYFYCLKKYPKILLSVPMMAWTFFLYILGVKTKTQFKEKMYKFLKYCDIQKDITDFWNINIDKIKPFYKNQQQKDDVIISASPEFLLAPICKTLKINYLMASVVDEHTGKYSGINCHGEEKVRRYREMFGDTKIHEFYSDSYSDAPLAKISEKAFIVKGNRLLDWDFSK